MMLLVILAVKLQKNDETTSFFVKKLQGVVVFLTEPGGAPLHALVHLSHNAILLLTA